MVAGGFYAFNLFAETAIWPSQSYLIWHYCLLPFVFLAWDRALTRGGARFIGVAVLVWLIAFNPSYTTTPLVITDAMVLGMLTLRHVVWKPRKSSRRLVLQRFGLLVSLWVIASAYWIVPVATYFGPEYTRGVAAGDIVSLLRLNSVTLSNALRLGGYWGLTSGFRGSNYYPWITWYTGWFSGLSFALPVIALVGALAQSPAGPRPRNGEDTGTRQATVTFWFLAVIAVLFMLCATGSNFPFGSLKLRILLDTGLAPEFRSVYQRAMMYVPLGSVPLVAAGLWWVDRWFGWLVTALGAGGGIRANLRRSTRVAGATLIGVTTIGMLIVVPALPMLSGAIYDGSGLLPSNRISVPADYKNVVATLESEDRGTDASTVVFPMGPSALTTLSWKGGADGYSGIQPLELLTSEPTILGDPSNLLLPELIPAIVGGGPRACAAMELLNARNVVVELDAEQAIETGLPGWYGVDPAKVAVALWGTSCLHTTYRDGSMWVFTKTNWTPMAVFGTTADFQSLGSHDLGPITAVSYKPSGPTYTIRRQPSDVKYVLLDRPFDSTWRLAGTKPVDVAGLTAFPTAKIIWTNDRATISNQAEGRFVDLSFLSVVEFAGGLLALGLLSVHGFHRRKHRAQ
jgi:hypothetical protein